MKPLFPDFIPSDKLFRVRRLCDAAAVAGLFALTGCGGGGSGGNPPSDGKVSATLSVYHALVTNEGETGAVDSIVNGAKIGTGTAYGSGATNQIVRWQPVKPELYTRFLRSDTPGRLLYQTSLLLDAGNAYALFLVGETNPATATKGADVIILPGPKTAPPAGSFRLRFLHALPESGPIDVYLTPNEMDLQLVASALTFKETTASFLVPISDNGAWRVIVTPAGVAPRFPAEGDTGSFLLPTASTAAGHSYIEAFTHKSASVQSAAAPLLVKEQ